MFLLPGGTHSAQSYIDSLPYSASESNAVYGEPISFVEDAKLSEEAQNVDRNGKI